MITEQIDCHFCLKRHTLVFTGNRLSGPLPRWIYPSPPEQLRATAKLVDDMVELAIKTAGHR